MHRAATRLGAPLLAVSLFLAPAVGADAATFFQSPSRNIGCVIGERGVRCDIAERDWRAPPKPSSCPVDWGQGLTLGLRGRARFVCAGDTVLRAGRRLPYGRSIRRGRFRCTSGRGGMRCVNRRNAHGFHLSRERARRF